AKHTNRLVVHLCAIAMLASSSSFAGLDLTWNACNIAPGARGDITFNCANPDTLYRLVGSFQLPSDLPNFVAMDFVIDVGSSASELPPFWHFETGGCNDAGISLRNARPAGNVECENPWGPGGAAGLPFLVYQSGVGGNPSR